MKGPYMKKEEIEMTDNLRNKLTDDELSGVAGGRILDATGTPDLYYSNPYNNWEVIDNNTGAVIKSFHTKGEAIDWTRNTYGGSNPDDIRDISYNEVVKLRTGQR